MTKERLQEIKSRWQAGDATGPQWHAWLKECVDENQKMAELLDKAPHTNLCSSWDKKECDCWKKSADALL